MDQYRWLVLDDDGVVDRFQTFAEAKAEYGEGQGFSYFVESDDAHAAREAAFSGLA